MRHRTADGRRQPREIVISEARIEALAENFASVWMRPPTAVELKGLIDDYVAEEVYYREAIAMGLDQDDTVIRRRLRQKMEFISENVADSVEPDRRTAAGLPRAERREVRTAGRAHLSAGVPERRAPRRHGARGRREAARRAAGGPRSGGSGRGRRHDVAACDDGGCLAAGDCQCLRPGVCPAGRRGAGWAMVGSDRIRLRRAPRQGRRTRRRRGADAGRDPPDRAS